MTKSASSLQLFLSFPKRDVVWRVGLIIAAAIAIYGPSLQGAWIGDDTWYVLNNHLLRDPNGLWKIWFVPGSWVEFYPVSESVQYLQWHLWHDDSFGYHLTNLVLHLTSCFLVWHLLGKLGLRLAWLGGLLFALHPEVVDSVVPPSELKNTLSLPFFLVAMGLYIDYEENKSGRCYLGALFFFFVAMLCKITMAPFPFLILLYAWWKRGRVDWGDVRASLPFLLVSLLLVSATILSGQLYTHTIARDVDPDAGLVGGIAFRLVLAGQILAFYFTRCVWPFDPVPVYPKWVVDPSDGMDFIPWVILGIALAFLWSKRKSWGRHVLLGLGFFAGFLVPVLGFRPISYMQMTWVLDHMVYLPIIGLIALPVAAIEDLLARLPSGLRGWSVGILAVGLACLAIQSRLYAGKFLNAETLDRYALSIDPGNKVLHTYLGGALQDKGDYPGAIEELETALQIDPQDQPALHEVGLAENGPTADGAIHAQLGEIMMAEQRLPEAVGEYEAAIRLHYQPIEMLSDEGTALIMNGNVAEGISQIKKAIAMDPGSALAQYDLGKALCQQGDLAGGVECYQQAIRLQPDYLDAYNNLGVTYYRQGNTSAAIEEFQQALKIDPDFAESRNNLLKLESTPGPSR